MSGSAFIRVNPRTNCIFVGVQILELHRSNAPAVVQAAVEQALRDHLTTPAGVRFCLDRLLDPTPSVTPLDLTDQPALAAICR